MYKLYRILALLCFIVGAILFFSGDEAYFRKSGGTGLVLLSTGTPLFVVLSLLEKRKITATNLSVVTKKISTLAKVGMGLCISGVLIYFSAFIGEQGLGAIGLALIGGVLFLVGLVLMLMGIFKKN